MQILRPSLSFLAVVFLIGYLFASYECLADCSEELATPVSQQHCCVQCCPNHNLGPSFQTQVWAKPLCSDAALTAQIASFYESPYLTKIDPPPMV